MAELNGSDITRENNTDSKVTFSGNEPKDLNVINALKSKNDVTASVQYDSSTPDKVKFKGLDDIDSICSDETESDEDKLPEIPDGGWGWVVVASAFLVSACADGLAFSFGLLRKELTLYFETTQSKTSLIGSFFIATPLLAGPVMSALVDRFGCRIMTIIAGILSTLGFLLAAISNSVEMLCLTFGLLSGLAMGILYVTAVVSVAFWFDKKRNLAVSLASCGIGFGTLIYSPMTKYFLEIYDWRNTIVLLAGTLLNMCVCGALMREPDWLKIKQKRERKSSKSRSRRSSSAGSISSKSIGAESVFLSPEELKALLKSGQSPEYILGTLVTTIAEAEKLEETTQMNVEESYKRVHSHVHLPTFIQQKEKVPVEVIEKLMTNKRLYNIILQNYPDLVTRRRSEVNISEENPSALKINEPAKLSVQVKIKKEKFESPGILTDSEGKQSQLPDDGKEKKEMNDNELKLKADTKLLQSAHKTKHRVHTAGTHQNQAGWLSKIYPDQHYLKDVPLYRNTIMYRGAMLNIPRYKLRAASLPNIYKNSMWSLASESDDGMTWHHRLWATVKSTFDFRMFTEFHFLMFNLSSLILSVWCIVPYFFLNSYMDAHNVEGEATMISIIGIASGVGIVGLGWTGDQPWVNVTKAYALCLTICGLSVAAYPLVITDFWLIAVVSAIFGVSFASSYSYTPAILMELMPIENFTVAYGLILLSQGIGHLAGPPLGGLLYDVTGHWELTFYVGGAWLVASGMCLVVIAYTKDMRICGRAPLLKEAEADKTESEVNV